MCSQTYTGGGGPPEGPPGVNTTSSEIAHCGVAKFIPSTVLDEARRFSAAFAPHSGGPGLASQRGPRAEGAIL